MIRYRRCYRCKRLTHRDELSLRSLAQGGRCWICLYCVTAEHEAARLVAFTMDGLALEVG